MLCLAPFVSVCFAWSASVCTLDLCERHCLGVSSVGTGTYKMGYFFNGLRGLIGHKAVLEKWKSVGYFLKVFGVNFPLGWRAESKAL